MNAKVLFERQDIKMIKFVSTAGEDVTQTKAEKWKEYISLKLPEQNKLKMRI